MNVDIEENRIRTEAIARVIMASARVQEQRKATAAQVEVVARIGERAIDPQRWLNALKEAVEEHEKVGLVPSLFDAMGLYGRERHHNRVLAWLLSPEAEHGAGSAVLLTITRGLGCKVLEADLADPKCMVEVRGEMRWPDGAGSSRQPDLLIISPRALLLIENKVWSGEGYKQYEEYDAALRRLADKRCAEEVRLFLAAPEERPTPPGWTGMIAHRELALWVTVAARSEGMTVWARTLCLLVAEEIAPSRRATHVRAAKRLMARIGPRGFRAHDAREAREILEGLGNAVLPWRNE